ncbi:MAG: hypothetical protein IT270_06980 [Saprospiraceae bacterium]|nr:hypothetical protein [Saprospiraceae bacterium]
MIEGPSWLFIIIYFFLFSVGLYPITYIFLKIKTFFNKQNDPNESILKLAYRVHVEHMSLFYLTFVLFGPAFAALIGLFAAMTWNVLNYFFTFETLINGEDIFQYSALGCHTIIQLVGYVSTLRNVANG